MQPIWSAFSEECRELRIIDVTHPSFRVEMSEKALVAMSQNFNSGIFHFGPSHALNPYRKALSFNAVALPLPRHRVANISKATVRVRWL